MELDTYEARFAEAVERSFRDDAIRTAVLIDDQFPDYLSIRDAAEGEFTEIERARNIYAFMQGKGLICDIHSWRAPSDADLHLLDKARKSDLILLDYQLGAAGVKAALKILRHLAISTHFNLVVLYTAEASPATALTVATAMRGVKPAADTLVPSADVLEKAEEVLADERFSTIDAAGLRAYLTDGKTPWAGDLGQALKDAQIPPQNVKPLADHIARQWIAELVDDYELDTDTELPVGCAIDADQPMWVHCGSCFVAIVPKLPASSKDDEGEYVWGRLGTALREWRPNIYRLILSDIQNALELEAVAHHENWLSDELALGLGLYLLENEDAARGKVSPSDIEGAAQSLIDRFVDIIRRRLATHEGISSTAIDLLGARLSTPVGQAPAGENARLIRARELAHVPANQQVDWRKKILPSVNAFMVSDAFRSGHITTGTVLRGPGNSFWLCASPSCDLVPREDGPILVQLMRLEKTGTPPEKFTAGEFVVIATSDEVMMLRAIEAKIRQPSLTTLVLPSGTRVNRDEDGIISISGWIANGEGLRAASVAHGFPAASDVALLAEAVMAEGDQGQDIAVAAAQEPAPAKASATEPEAVAIASLEGPLAEPPQQVGEEAASKGALPTKFMVISQLRSAFATRFLMAAGQHQSRVGVDFIDP